MHQGSGEGTMIRTLALTAALIGGFMIVHLIADEARAQQMLTGRRVTAADAASNGEARAERRVALVVGNSNYEAERISLPNPKNDATDIAQALQNLGFDVRTAIDATKQEFERKLADFARRGKNADMALFFYAGHAMQLQGQNYLMPVDGELKDGDSIWSMVRLDEVREALDRVNGLKVMILDACRNNPLSDRLYRSLEGGGNQRGLARINRTDGMIVVYATAADEVAADGKGRNSPFTSALLTRMDEAGLEITKMLKLVGLDVSAQTGGRQRPEITMQSYNDYFLNQRDRIAWEKIKDSADPSALQDFIERFPSSPHYPVVWDRLGRLAPSVQTIQPKPAPPSPVLHDQSPVSMQNVPPKPISFSPMPIDQSTAPPVPVMTVPPAQQPVQPAGPLSGDQAATPKLDATADITPFDAPDKTERKPNMGPHIDQPGHGTEKSSAAPGAGLHKGAKGPPDVSPPGKRRVERGKPGAGLPSIRDAGSTKTPPQPSPPVANPGKASRPAAPPTMLGSAF
jgi:Caspase domain